MAAWPRAAHQKWWGGVRKSLFSRSWCAAGPLFYHERFQEEGFLWLVYVKPETQAPQLLNSSHYAPIGAARPHRGNASCIHQRCLENSLQTEQSVALVTQPMGLIGRWLLLVCWDKCISVWVEGEVGGVFKAACWERERQRERRRRRGLGRTGLRWQEVWISQRIGFALHHRAGAEVESWCVLWLVFASRMTVSLQTDYGWFCDPFLNFCFVLVSLFLMKLWILGALSCAVDVLNKQYNYYLFLCCCCIIQ